MKKVFTAKDIAGLLGVCDKTAYSLIRQAITTGKTFKVVKIGRLYRIPATPFLEWLDNYEEVI